MYNDPFLSLPDYVQSFTDFEQFQYTEVFDRTSPELISQEHLFGNVINHGKLIDKSSLAGRFPIIVVDDGYKAEFTGDYPFGLANSEQYLSYINQYKDSDAISTWYKKHWEIKSLLLKNNGKNIYYQWFINNPSILKAAKEYFGKFDCCEAIHFDRLMEMFLCEVGNVFYQYRVELENPDCTVTKSKGEIDNTVEAAKVVLKGLYSGISPIDESVHDSLTMNLKEFIVEAPLIARHALPKNQSAMLPERLLIRRLGLYFIKNHNDPLLSVVKHLVKAVNPDYDPKEISNNLKGLVVVEDDTYKKKMNESKQALNEQALEWHQQYKF